ncbi:hypothetical protein ACFQO1_12470 [Jejudonia soesokkakensis]|uniref:Uncharacterized protein n=1 Tax=Jejudonia soesokkakensis TaxID=1323432 RepID=A0ABW2MU97_9FLAO
MKTFLFLSLSILIHFGSLAQSLNTNTEIKEKSNRTTSEKLCRYVAADQKGKILAGNLIKIERKISNAAVTISVTKTEGESRATASIYIDEKFVDRLVFNPDDRDTTLTKNLSEVNGKTVRLEIINQSKSAFFVYSASIETNSNSLLEKGNQIKGILLGQTKKTITSFASCTNRASILINRTDGSARAAVKIWKRNDKNWELLETKTFETLQPNNQLILNYNTSKPLKIEIKNISVKEKFKYHIDVVAVH